MQKLFVRGSAAALSVVLFTTNVALSHAVQVNMWDQRRLAITPLASSLPSVSASAISSSLPLSNVKRFSNVSSPSNSLTSVLSALPLSAGTIRKVSQPAHPSGKILVHIQDVHRNYDAQQNIALAVSRLVTANAVDVVALEGAFVPLSFEWFVRYPHSDTVSAVADWLLKESRISGPVHAAMRLASTASLPRYLGVDDKRHYDANIEAYRRSSSKISSMKKQLSSQRRLLASEKETFLNPALKQFDAHVSAYQQGSLSWGNYVQILDSYKPKFSDAMRDFLAALSMERSLNVSAVESERARLITRLASLLSTADADQLVRVSAAYRLGSLSDAEFYRFLQRLCEKHNLRLDGFPAMSSYIQYVLKSDALDIDAIVRDVTLAETTIGMELAATEREKILLRRTRQMYLKEKLVDFALTKNEWDEYKRTIDRGDIHLASFEDFYKEAESRDAAMAANVQRALSEPKSSVAVIVTGGFHSEGLTAALLAEGATVVSFTPKISKVTDGASSSYLSAFTQRKTPLDQLFAGEKLFLAADPMASIDLVEPVIETAQIARNTGGISKRKLLLGGTLVVAVAAVGAVLTIRSVSVELSWWETLKHWLHDARTWIGFGALLSMIKTTPSSANDANNDGFRTVYDGFAKNFKTNGFNWEKISNVFNEYLNRTPEGTVVAKKVASPRIRDLEMVLTADDTDVFNAPLDEIYRILIEHGADLWTLPIEQRHVTLVPAFSITEGADLATFDAQMAKNLTPLLGKDNFNIQLINPRLIMNTDGTLMIGWQVSGADIQDVRKRAYVVTAQTKGLMNIVHNSLGRVVPPSTPLSDEQNQSLRNKITEKINEINVRLAAKNISITPAYTRYTELVGALSSETKDFARFGEKTPIAAAASISELRTQIESILGRELVAPTGISKFLKKDPVVLLRAWVQDLPSKKLRTLVSVDLLRSELGITLGGQTPSAAQFTEAADAIERFVAAEAAVVKVVSTQQRVINATQRLIHVLEVEKWVDGNYVGPVISELKNLLITRHIGVSKEMDPSMLACVVAGGIMLFNENIVPTISDDELMIFIGHEVMHKLPHQLRRTFRSAANNYGPPHEYFSAAKGSSRREELKKVIALAALNEFEALEFEFRLRAHLASLQGKTLLQYFEMLAQQAEANNLMDMAEGYRQSMQYITESGEIDEPSFWLFLAQYVLQGDPGIKQLFMNVAAFERGFTPDSMPRAEISRWILTWIRDPAYNDFVNQKLVLPKTQKAGKANDAPFVEVLDVLRPIKFWHDHAALEDGQQRKRIRGILEIWGAMIATSALPGFIFVAAMGMLNLSAHQPISWWVYTAPFVTAIVSYAYGRFLLWLRYDEKLLAAVSAREVLLTPIFWPFVFAMIGNVWRHRLWNELHPDARLSKNQLPTIYKELEYNLGVQNVGVQERSTRLRATWSRYQFSNAYIGTHPVVQAQWTNNSLGQRIMAGLLFATDDTIRLWTEMGLVPVNSVSRFRGGEWTDDDIHQLLLRLPKFLPDNMPTRARASALEITLVGENPLLKITRFRIVYEYLQEKINPANRNSAAVEEAIFKASRFIDSPQKMADMRTLVSILEEKGIVSEQMSADVQEKWLSTLYGLVMGGKEIPLYLEGVLNQFYEHGFWYPVRDPESAKQWFIVASRIALQWKLTTWVFTSVLARFQSEGFGSGLVDPTLRAKYLVSLYAISLQGPDGLRPLDDLFQAYAAAHGPVPSDTDNVHAFLPLVWRALRKQKNGAELAALIKQYRSIDANQRISWLDTKIKEWTPETAANILPAWEKPASKKTTWDLYPDQGNPFERPFVLFVNDNDGSSTKSTVAPNLSIAELLQEWAELDQTVFFGVPPEMKTDDFQRNLALDIDSVSKGEMLLAVARDVASRLQTTKDAVLSKTLVVGDSENDLPMLDLVASAGGVALWVGDPYFPGLDPRYTKLSVFGVDATHLAIKTHIMWLQSSRQSSLGKSRPSLKSTALATDPRKTVSTPNRYIPIEYQGKKYRLGSEVSETTPKRKKALSILKHLNVPLSPKGINPHIVDHWGERNLIYRIVWDLCYASDDTIALWNEFGFITTESISALRAGRWIPEDMHTFLYSLPDWLPEHMRSSTQQEALVAMLKTQNPLLALTRFRIVYGYFVEASSPRNIEDLNLQRAITKAATHLSNLEVENIRLVISVLKSNGITGEHMSANLQRKWITVIYRCARENVDCVARVQHYIDRLREVGFSYPSGYPFFEELWLLVLTKGLDQKIEEWQLPQLANRYTEAGVDASALSPELKKQYLIALHGLMRSQEDAWAGLNGILDAYQSAQGPPLNDPANLVAFLPLSWRAVDHGFSGEQLAAAMETYQSLPVEERAKWLRTQVVKWKPRHGLGYISGWERHAAAELMLPRTKALGFNPAITESLDALLWNTFLDAHPDDGQRAKRAVGLGQIWKGMILSSISVGVALSVGAAILSLVFHQQIPTWLYWAPPIATPILSICWGYLLLLAKQQHRLEASSHFLGAFVWPHMLPFLPAYIGSYYAHQRWNKNNPDALLSRDRSRPDPRKIQKKTKPALETTSGLRTVDSLLGVLLEHAAGLKISLAPGNRDLQQWGKNISVLLSARNYSPGFEEFVTNVGRLGFVYDRAWLKHVWDYAENPKNNKLLAAMGELAVAFRFYSSPDIANFIPGLNDGDPREGPIVLVGVNPTQLGDLFLEQSTNPMRRRAIVIEVDPFRVAYLRRVLKESPHQDFIEIRAGNVFDVLVPLVAQVKPVLIYMSNFGLDMGWAKLPELLLPENLTFRKAILEVQQQIRLLGPEYFLESNNSHLPYWFDAWGIVWDKFLDSINNAHPDIAWAFEYATNGHMSANQIVVDALARFATQNGYVHSSEYSRMSRFHKSVQWSFDRVKPSVSIPASSKTVLVKPTTFKLGVLQGLSEHQIREELAPKDEALAALLWNTFLDAHPDDGQRAKRAVGLGQIWKGMILSSISVGVALSVGAAILSLVFHQQIPTWLYWAPPIATPILSICWGYLLLLAKQQHRLEASSHFLGAFVWPHMLPFLPAYIGNYYAHQRWNRRHPDAALTRPNKRPHPDFFKLPSGAQPLVDFNVLDIDANVDSVYKSALKIYRDTWLELRQVPGTFPFDVIALFGARGMNRLVVLFVEGILDRTRSLFERRVLVTAFLKLQPRARFFKDADKVFLPRALEYFVQTYARKIGVHVSEVNSNEGLKSLLYPDPEDSNRLVFSSEFESRIKWIRDISERKKIESLYQKSVFERRAASSLLSYVLRLDTSRKSLVLVLDELPRLRSNSPVHGELVLLLMRAQVECFGANSPYLEKIAEEFKWACSRASGKRLSEFLNALQQWPELNEHFALRGFHDQLLRGIEQEIVRLETRGRSSRTNKIWKLHARLNALQDAFYYGVVSWELANRKNVAPFVTELIRIVSNSRRHLVTHSEVDRVLTLYAHEPDVWRWYVSKLDPAGDLESDRYPGSISALLKMLLRSRTPQQDRLVYIALSNATRDEKYKIANDSLVPIRFRLFAAQDWSVTEHGDIMPFVDSVAPATIAWLKEIKTDTVRFDHFLSNVHGRDLEAVVYNMAVMVVTANKLRYFRSVQNQNEMLSRIGASAIWDYYDNASSSLAYGVPKVRKYGPAVFLLIASHEIMHGVIHGNYPIEGPELVQHLIEELLCDQNARVLAEAVGIKFESIDAVFQGESRHALITHMAYKSHDGARSQQHFLGSIVAQNPSGFLIAALSALADFPKQNWYASFIQLIIRKYLGLAIDVPEAPVVSDSEWERWLDHFEPLGIMIAQRIVPVSAIDVTAASQEADTRISAPALADARMISGLDGATQQKIHSMFPSPGNNPSPRKITRQQPSTSDPSFVSERQQLIGIVRGRVEGGLHTHTGGKSHAQRTVEELVSFAETMANAGLIPGIDLISVLEKVRQRTAEPLAFLMTPDVDPHEVINAGADILIGSGWQHAAIEKIHRSAPVLVIEEIDGNDRNAAIANFGNAILNGVDGVLLKRYAHWKDDVPALLAAHPDKLIVVAGGILPESSLNENNGELRMQIPDAVSVSDVLREFPNVTVAAALNPADQNNMLMSKRVAKIAGEIEQAAHGRVLQPVIDFLAMREELPEKADLLLFLGCDDFELMDRAVKYFKEGRVPRILISGYRGTLTAPLILKAAQYGVVISDDEKNTISEAEIIARYMELRGVRRGAMVLETKSTNTPENLDFSIPLIESLRNGEQPIQTIIMMQTALRQRRADATARPRMPAKFKVYNDTTPGPSAWTSTNPDLVDVVLSEIGKLSAYAEKGDIAATVVPENIKRLVDTLREWNSRDIGMLGLLSALVLLNSGANAENVLQLVSGILLSFTVIGGFIYFRWAKKKINLGEAMRWVFAAAFFVTIGKEALNSDPLRHLLMSVVYGLLGFPAFLFIVGWIVMTSQDGFKLRQGILSAVLVMILVPFAFPQAYGEDVAKIISSVLFSGFIGWSAYWAWGAAQRLGMRVIRQISNMKTARAVASKKRDLLVAVQQMAAALEHSDPAARALGLLPQIQRRHELANPLKPLNGADAVNAELVEMIVSEAQLKGFDVANLSDAEMAQVVWSVQWKLSGAQYSTRHYTGTVILPLDSSTSLESEDAALSMLRKSEDELVLVGPALQAQRLASRLRENPAYEKRVRVVPLDDASRDGNPNLDLILPALVKDVSHPVRHATVVFDEGFVLSPETVAFCEGTGANFNVIPWASYIRGWMETAAPLPLAQQLMTQLAVLINA